METVVECLPREGVASMQSLHSLDDELIVENLKRRHATHAVYSDIGARIVISTNPYDWRSSMPLYAKRQRDAYRNKAVNEMPPHLYIAAEVARRQACAPHSLRPQAILVSGQSGAGKTEAVKLILEFISEGVRFERRPVSMGSPSAAGTAAAAAAALPQRLLEVSPLLEAFGNARTLLNHNSSRFGKLLSLHFASAKSDDLENREPHANSATPSTIAGDERRLAGAQIRTYLLETVRIAQHAEGESSFHVFYQMLNGLAPAELRRLRLRECGSFSPKAMCSNAIPAPVSTTSSSVLEPRPPAVQLHASGSVPASGNIHAYLVAKSGSAMGGASAPPGSSGAPDSRGASPAVPAHSADAWARTSTSAAAVGIAPSELTSMCEVLAAILHLGDVRFERAFADDDVSGGASQVAPASAAAAEAAAEMLRVSPDALNLALTSRTLSIRGEAPLQCPRSVDQAPAAADALAKLLYSGLFSWLVGRLNQALSGKGCPTPGNATLCGGRGSSAIALLDIFGFEALEHNSFEQLCINYANEKLQRQFNVATFEAAAVECAAEGIHIESAEWEDNLPCLALLEGAGPPPGILLLLNEECALGEGSDSKFASKVRQVHGQHSSMVLQRPRGSPRLVSPRAEPSPRLLTARVGSPPHQGLAAAAPLLTLRHYAGDVTYNLDGFRRKNDDSVDATLAALLGSSTFDLVRELSSAGDDGALHVTTQALAPARDPSTPQPHLGPRRGRPTSTRRRQASPTICGQFISQLGQLHGLLEASDCHYVRCIKPNKVAAADVWDKEFVSEQLRQSGVYCAARAARRGYPDRIPFHEFFGRFGSLASGAMVANGFDWSGTACARL